MKFAKQFYSFLGLTFLGLLSAYLLSGCGRDDALETDPELIPYFDLFAAEGAKRGITVDYVASNIEGLIQNIPQVEVLGQCFRNEQRPRKVIVDRSYWNNASEPDRQFLIFHELGHCFLDLEHDDSVDSLNNCVSIMHSTVDVCRFVLNDDTRDGYFDELFSK